MKLLLCNCRTCRYVRRSGTDQDFRIRHLRKGARSRVRAALRAGKTEGLPEKVAIGYTD